MINKLHEIPTFSLFNNYEIIRKMKFKINEIIDAINSPAPAPSGSGINYSFEEQKIGTAFGEDLYQCSFIIDRTNETQYKDDTVEFPDVKNFIKSDVVVLDNENPIVTSGEVNKTLLSSYASSGTKAVYDITEYGNDTEKNANLYFGFGNTYSASDYPYLFITIQYTKKLA